MRHFFAYHAYINTISGLCADHPTTRLQLQGELQAKTDAPKLYKGVIHGIKVIGQNEGIRGLFRGLGSAVRNTHTPNPPLQGIYTDKKRQYIYQIILNGCRFGFYEPMRQRITKFFFHDANVQSLGANLFAGATSGVLGAILGSPFFLVKTRLQSYSPSLPVGTQHQYRNALDGLRQIHCSEGITGLWRGVGAATVRTGFGSAVQLPTYFFAKRRLIKHLDMQEGLPLHLASSTISGFVVCCFMHPPGKEQDHHLLLFKNWEG